MGPMKTEPTSSQYLADNRDPARAGPVGDWRGNPEAVTTDWCLATLYAIAAVAILVLLPAGHPLEAGAALAAVFGCVLGEAVPLPLSRGYALILQPAFVLMLFALPLNVVPITVAVAISVGRAVRKHSLPLARLPFVLGDSWFCVPPVLVLTVGAPGPASWSHWPVYVLAFFSQIALDVVLNVGRRLLSGETSDFDWEVALAPMTIDALLTPAGLAAATIAGRMPVAAVSLLAGVMGVMVLLQRERTGRLEHQERALRDALTGLANRALFNELLDAATRRCARAGASTAVLLMDLDQFKAINDEHGHLAGDRVLQAFAQRIGGRVRDSDTVARLGGDEFAVLLAEPATLETARVVAEGLREGCKSPLVIPDVGELSVSASIGAGEFGVGATPIEALQAADLDMYAEKRRRQRRSGSQDGELLKRGTELGRYRIDRAIARGGMGVVYVAFADDGEMVAIKVIAPELVQRKDVRQRFAREAAASRKLDHPHLVRVRESGERAGRPYVVMDLIEGNTLREELLATGPMAPLRAAALVQQIASALDHAHTRGLVHRDVKPANVMVASREGDHAYLLDFGISGLLAAETSLTRTGSWVGSVDYVAPEVLEGASPDARADVYSLGCLLYELLTGSVPYARDSDAAKLFAHLNAPPPSLALDDPRLCERLGLVIDAALAKQPEERFTTAGALAVAVVTAVGTVDSAEATTDATTDATSVVVSSGDRARGPGIS